MGARSSAHTFEKDYRMSISLITEAAKSHGHPVKRFAPKEQELLHCVKTYVDTVTGTMSTLPQYNIFIGNSTSVATVTNTALSGNVTGKINSSTCTITIGAPGVVTASSGSYALGDCIVFSTTGSLPAPFVAGIPYYVSNLLSPTQFFVSGTRSVLNHFWTVGSQSGVHTVSSSGLSVRPLSLSNEDLAAEAHISLSKLEDVLGGSVIIGNDDNHPVAQVVSGAMQISNMGIATLNNNVVDVPNLTDDVMQQSSTYTVGHITGIYNSPEVIIESPGPGRLIVVDEVIFFHQGFGKTNFADGGDIQICYTATDTIFSIDKKLLTDFEDTYYLVKPSFYSMSEQTGQVEKKMTTYIDSPITITNIVGPFTGGEPDNTLKVQIRYHIKTLIT